MFVRYSVVFNNVNGSKKVMKSIGCLSDSFRWFRKRVSKRSFAMEGGKDHSNHQCFMLTGNAQLHLQRGNIVEWEGDAIVNAGTSSLGLLSIETLS